MNRGNLNQPRRKQSVLWLGSPFREGGKGQLRPLYSHYTSSRGRRDSTQAKERTLTTSSTKTPLLAPREDPVQPPEALHLHQCPEAETDGSARTSSS